MALAELTGANIENFHDDLWVCSKMFNWYTEERKRRVKMRS